LVEEVGRVGLVLLFFILGLDFPLRRIGEISRRVWSAGLMDLAANCLLLLVVGLLFGLDFLTAFTIATVAYATSSSITVKMLEEKKRLAGPESEYLLALLIFEDLASPLLVSVLFGLQRDGALSLSLLGLLVLKIIVLLGLALGAGAFLFSRLKSFFARYLREDFLPPFLVGLALGYAGLAVWLGLSEVLGAFLAGVMLAESEHAGPLENLLLSLRDLTLPFFFFWFGSSLRWAGGISSWTLLTVMLLLATLGKLFAVYAGGRKFGLSPRVSARAALSSNTRGEFSIVAASLAAVELKLLCGVFITVSALLGVVLFNLAPPLSAWFQKKFFPAPSAISERSGAGR